MFCLMLCCSHLPPSKLATLATPCHFCSTFSLLISPQSPVGLPVVYSVVLLFCMNDIEQMCPFIFFRTKVYPKGNLDSVMFMIKYSHVCLQCFSSLIVQVWLVLLGRRQGYTLILKDQKILSGMQLKLSTSELSYEYFFLVSLLLKIITPLVHMCLCKTSTSLAVVLMRF